MVGEGGGGETGQGGSRLREGDKAMGLVMV